MHKNTKNGRGGVVDGGVDTVLKAIPTTDAGGWCEKWEILGIARAQKEELGSSVLRLRIALFVKRFCLFLCRASSLLSSCPRFRPAVSNTARFEAKRNLPIVELPSFSADATVASREKLSSDISDTSRPLAGTLLE